MGVKALVYFEVVTTLALFIGWAAITISRAGVGIDAAAALRRAQLARRRSADRGRTSSSTSFPRTSPSRWPRAQVLQIVVFSVLFGIALAMLPEREAAADAGVRREPGRDDVQVHEHRDAVRADRRRRGDRLHGRPHGARHPGEPVQAAGDASTWRSSCSSLRRAAAGGAAWRACRSGGSSQAVAEPVSIAFATTSSEAALPRAMEAMEQLGVPRQIVAFVMPTGYSFNLDGTHAVSVAGVDLRRAGGGHRAVASASSS